MEERNDMLHINMWIPKDIISTMELYAPGKTTSDKIRDFLCSEYKHKDYILLQIEECERRLSYLKSALKNNIFSEEYETPEEERNFFKETLAVLERNPEVLDGRCRSYNYQFKRRLHVGEFKLLVEKMRN